MRLAAALVIVALAGGAHAMAAAAVPHHHAGRQAGAARAAILASSFAPARIDVVAGDTVVWTNDSVRRHTVTSQDDTWSSDMLLPRQRYTHQFEGVASYDYYCRLHPGMRGRVDAHAAILEAPTGPAAPGATLTLTGRAIRGAGRAIRIEADAGDGYREAARVDVADDGTYAARVTPAGTTTYRAVTADGATSPPVRVVAVERAIHARARHAGGRTSIAVRVTPATPRGHVVLQARLRERFGWWPIATTRLDGASSARFALRGHRRARVRAVLTLPDRATPLAVGTPFRARVPRFTS